MNKLTVRLLALGTAAALALTGCGSTAVIPAESSASEAASTAEAVSATPDTGDIVILYTNDVHCGLTDAIGYAGLAAYRDAMAATTPYLTLVDCGDAIQGDTIGAVSSGEYIIDIMNELGYDYAILGNHEFDYGMDQLKLLLGEADAEYLGCNLRYTGTAESALSAVQPYALAEYGATTVAFVGVSTPDSVTSSRPAYFKDEDGNFIYDFYGGDDGAELYAQVQDTVDAAREAGADYVVVLSHLGDTEAQEPYSSVDLAGHTTGIDVILDGHAHTVLPCRMEENADGAEVLISSTGTKLNYIGQLVISESGRLTTSLISAYAPREEAAQTYIDGLVATYEADLSKVVASSDVTLSCADENGNRLVRSRETTIGNFCADAYRSVAGADIALVNGGGVRADLNAGDITYEDIIAVHPFGNALCCVEATGQQILDALELASRKTTADIKEESGGFLQVSGLKYTIDTSIAPTVTLDSAGMFTGVTGERRVQDVQVLGADGNYTALDPAATYTVAGSNYTLQDGGDGMNLFDDDPVVIDRGMIDYEVLITYLRDTLNGQAGTLYGSTEGRITVK